jgi:farnesyl-diphosphate farnesyltransferase
MSIREIALDTLKATSRTFFISILRLPVGLQEAVTSAYLCMRAIDEIEDHPYLDRPTKIRSLRLISQGLQEQTELEHFAYDQFAAIFAEYQSTLPAVTLELAQWACYAPPEIAPRIWDATAAMAERMANWVENGWQILTEADLNRYTFSVAGAVGLLLCDVWAWYSSEQLNRSHALQFGRGLQAVNILRNRGDDLARGVDFFPHGWTHEQMHHYAHHHLSLAESYARTHAANAFSSFIEIPLMLAFATLDALARGETKLSRAAVNELLEHS